MANQDGYDHLRESADAPVGTVTLMLPLSVQEAECLIGDMLWAVDELVDMHNENIGTENHATHHADLLNHEAVLNRLLSLGAGRLGNVDQKSLQWATDNLMNAYRRCAGHDTMLHSHGEQQHSHPERDHPHAEWSRMGMAERES